MAHSTPEGRAPAVERGHEIFDLNVSYVRWFSLGVVVLLIVTATAAFTIMGGLRISPAPRGAPAAEATESAPFATLQSAPQDELRSYRRAKATGLDGYRWIDRHDGVVQIPVERAMELVAAEGVAQGVRPGIKPAAPSAAQPGPGDPR
jgi:hypothetical protein